jgi:hypothetical protein
MDVLKILHAQALVVLNNARIDEQRALALRQRPRNRYWKKMRNRGIAETKVDRLERRHTELHNAVMFAERRVRKLEAQLENRGAPGGS